MSIRAFIVAAAVAAGTFGIADRADAQWRRYSGYNYSYPTYSYAVPRYYSSPVVTTGYATPYVSSYTPGTVVYSGGNYYDPNVWSAPTYGSYSNSYPSYYGSGYNSYGNYNGVNINRSGVNVGGRPIWRW